MDILNETPRPGDKKVAAHLAQGLTLVPYYARNARGVPTACCAWIRLKHGESIAQAVARLTYPNNSSISAGTCKKES